MQDTCVPYSEGFQNWVQAKKVQSQDLRFLALLTETEQYQRFASVSDDFFKSGPSFSEGLQTLETIVDLILMKKADAIPAYDGTPNWRQQLLQIRNPVTSSNDVARKTAIEQLKWPQGSKIKVERRGDRHGVELKVFISSSTDLTKIISSLERVKDDFPV